MATLDFASSNGESSSDSPGLTPSGSHTPAPTCRAGIVIFSGGSAANTLVDLFERVRSANDTTLSYVVPISDNGGSSSELIRVFGGPGKPCSLRFHPNHDLHCYRQSRHAADEHVQALETYAPGWFASYLRRKMARPTRSSNSSTTAYQNPTQTPEANGTI